MNDTSKIYRDEDGNYRDKTEQQLAEQEEIAAAAGPDAEPVPFTEDGAIDGEQILEDVVSNTGTTTETGTTEPKATAKTRKQ